MKLLMHTCCAPCSVYCIKSLREEGIEPTCYWYNPNIHPYIEYKTRRDTLIEYSKMANFELIIKDFMKSRIKKDLVIITNLSSSNYYQELVLVTNCDKDSRIKFIDGVYDGEKLAVIRKNAYLYIHGHSVGGTNPSLIEAISLTDLNILYDVCFNHDIGLDTALYFKEEGSLKKLLDNTKLLDQKREELGPKAKKRIQENFTWDKIVEEYKDIMK